jgi:hypothetical protein
MGDHKKLNCEYPPGTLRNATTSSNIPAVANALKVMPGVGKPFLIFQTLPGLVTMAAFDMYPDYVVSADSAENETLINAMLATPPTDALTY